MNTTHRLFAILLAFTSSCCSFKQPHEIGTQEAIWEDLTIQKLMPDYAVFPSIEPYLPKNFIALKHPDPARFGELYWGPKDVLETFFLSNGEQLKSAIFAVDISPSLAQIDENSFSDESLLTGSIEFFESQGLKNVAATKSHWGLHPVMNCRVTSEGEERYVAWIGLNNGEAVLCIILLYPPNQTSPSEEDLQVWNDFLKKTQPLEMHEFLKSHGQDLREGLTLVNVFGSVLKVSGEKRSKDDKIQIIIKPVDNQISCKCENVAEERIAASWHFNEPILHIQSVIQKTGSANIINQATINVLLKKVSEFSFHETGCDPTNLSQKEYGNVSILNFCEKDVIDTEIATGVCEDTMCVPETSADLPRSELFPPLQGTIINDRYYAPQNVFSCQADRFGANTYTSQDVLLDYAACVGFYSETGKFKTAEVIFMPGAEKKILDKNDLKDWFERLGIGILKDVDHAQGIEILTEELVDENMLFVAISVAKNSFLKTNNGEFIPSTRGYLVFQDGDKVAVLSNQILTLLLEPHTPRKHIETLKKDILDFRKTFEFGPLPQLPTEAQIPES
jgi:hypothetical protein